MKRARARVTRAMMMAMRVAGEEEGEGGKATRVAGERTATSMKSAMAKKMWKAGKEEGIGRVSKSNADDKEDGDGKRQRQQPS
jgi:hypothetical protein